MTVAERIRVERKKAGLTQKELGERMGVTSVAVTQYESGKRIPKIDTLQRIADALGVNVGTLIYGANTETVDRDGVVYSGSHISQKAIDDDKGIIDYHVTKELPDDPTTGKAILHETAVAFDEVTGNIVDVLKDFAEEEKRVVLDLVNMMRRKKGNGEGGDDK